MKPDFNELALATLSQLLSGQRRQSLKAWLEFFCLGRKHLGKHKGTLTQFCKGHKKNFEP
jgi:hypothetical protein